MFYELPYTRQTPTACDDKSSVSSRFCKWLCKHNDSPTRAFTAVSVVTMTVLVCAIITVTSYWAQCLLKSPASRLFTQVFVQAQIKKISKLRGPMNSPHQRPVTRKCHHDVTQCLYKRHHHRKFPRHPMVWSWLLWFFGKGEERLQQNIYSIKGNGFMLHKCIPIWKILSIFCVGCLFHRPMHAR